MFCFRLLALKLQKFRTNFKRLIFYGDSKLFCRIALYGVRLRVGRGAGALGALGAKKQRPRLRALQNLELLNLQNLQHCGRITACMAII